MSMKPERFETNEPLRLEHIFSEYYARLVHFCFQIVHDKSAAEDIVQDAFVNYWDLRQTVLNNKQSIKSFLYSSVRNASFNYIRHDKVIEKYIQSLEPDPVEEINAMHYIIRSEVLGEIHKAISSLPESCQRISRMGYLEGKKNQEIAEELGISVNTVKTQKQRALQLLRLKLSPEFFAVLVLLTDRF